MKARGLLVLVVVVALAIQAVKSDSSEWKNFQEKYGRAYSLQEEHFRREIFERNLEFIQKYNAEHPNGAHMGINKFSDLTADEFRQVRQNAKKPNKPAPHVASKPTANSYLCPYPLNLPGQWDWTQITPPSNQGQLGSSAVYSTIESLADGFAISTGEIAVPLSRQELLDCVGDDSTPPQYFQYLVSQGGIESEAAYPYTGESGPCKAAVNQSIAARVDSYTMVQAGNETELACAAFYYQPVTICLNAEPLQLYTGGIFNSPCSNQIDDCMLVTGFGVQNGQSYWIIENSWGSDWGIDGFLWLARNANNLCGVASYASFPSVSSPSK